MTLSGDLLKFSQDEKIELFVLDASKYGAGIFRFHAGTNQFTGDVVWQGQTFTAIPVTATGFAFDGSKFPRPVLQVANNGGIFSTLTRVNNDLIGCKVTRLQTTARYLDAANFVSGNPNANSSEHFPDEIYYVTRKTGENRVFIEFELGSALDMKGVFLPKRQVIANICPFKYKGQECGYAGGPVATDEDRPTSDAGEDACSKTLTGCKYRFLSGELPFGGFPGAAGLEF